MTDERGASHRFREETKWKDARERTSKGARAACVIGAPACLTEAEKGVPAGDSKRSMLASGCQWERCVLPLRGGVFARPLLFGNKYSFRQMMECRLLETRKATKKNGKPANSHVTQASTWLWKFSHPGRACRPPGVHGHLGQLGDALLRPAQRVQKAGKRIQRHARLCLDTGVYRNRSCSPLPRKVPVCRRTSNRSPGGRLHAHVDR